jgi:hypothetical protein
MTLPRTVPPTLTPTRIPVPHPHGRLWRTLIAGAQFAACLALTAAIEGCWPQRKEEK